MSDYKNFIVYVAICALLGLLAYYLLGCSPDGSQAVPNTAAVVQYDLSLVECQKRARSAPAPERFDRYIECEKAVSRHYCDQSLDLRKTWSRCAEVSP